MKYFITGLIVAIVISAFLAIRILMLVGESAVGTSKAIVDISEYARNSSDPKIDSVRQMYMFILFGIKDKTIQITFRDDSSFINGMEVPIDEIEFRVDSIMQMIRQNLFFDERDITINITIENACSAYLRSDIDLWSQKYGKERVIGDQNCFR
jgi:hypothetical protein